MRRVYEALKLPAFGVAEPSMRSYVGSPSGYEKNGYMALAPQSRNGTAKRNRGGSGRGNNRGGRAGGFLQPQNQRRGGRPARLAALARFDPCPRLGTAR